ncbi:MAG: OmpH family outer membrane protein [Bacteroidia bacterium]|jgi:outer membrane protein|nr:OmpH family outer membrane protein [Bacteroidales bacterium]MDD3962633.1 OmpH family outer membrane protein [Bacteroidales bacterium]MDY0285561.1 OmpH family outer membrane protein [Bacteroidales bacterium]NCD42520.1 OmpH family outer membrane protein [Bacteroidia bacterium]
MKNVLKISIVVALVFAAGINTQAQNKAKFGHINFAELYAMMPGQDTVKVLYEAYAKDIQSQFQVMQSEYETKLMDYQQNSGAMSDIIRETKEKEIIDLQNRIEAFQYSAQEKMTNKENQLTAPMIEKARKAVEEVAKENAYTYIFNSSEGLILYAEPADNVMPLVKKKLGIQ